MRDMSAYLVRAGKVQAVAGLHWVALNAQNRKADRKDLILAAKEAGSRYASYYANTGADYRLAGILPASTPKSCQNKPSAAVWLAESVERETIFIEQLPSGRFWIVNVAPQSIMLRSDRIEDSERAGELLDELLADLLGGGGEFDIVVSGEGIPPSSKIGDAMDKVRHASLAELVAGQPPASAKIKQVSGIPASLVIALVAFVAIAFLGTGFWWWRGKLEEERLATEAQTAMLAQQAAMKGNEAAQRLQIEHAVADALAVDTATPDPDRLLRTCVSSLQTFSRTLGGWSQQNVSCDFRGHVVTAQYARQSQGGSPSSRFATNESLQQAAERSGLQVSVQIAGETATMSLSILNAEARQTLQREQLPDIGLAANAVPSRLQWAEAAIPGFSADIGDAAPRDILPAAPADGSQVSSAIPAELGYLRGSLKAAGPSLWSALAVSYSWPFVNIDRVVLIPRDKGRYAWSLEGTYVAKGGI